MVLSRSYRGREAESSQICFCLGFAQSLRAQSKDNGDEAPVSPGQEGWVFPCRYRPVSFGLIWPYMTGGWKTLPITAGFQA